MNNDLEKVWEDRLFDARFVASEARAQLTVGSPRQISWAEDLRSDQLMEFCRVQIAVEMLEGGMDRGDARDLLWGSTFRGHEPDVILNQAYTARSMKIDAKNFRALIAWVAAKPEAKWWIDLRGASISTVLKEWQRQTETA